jgi:hypothetical protein
MIGIAVTSFRNYLVTLLAAMAAPFIVSSGNYLPPSRLVSSARLTVPGRRVPD